METRSVSAYGSVAIQMPQDPAPPDCCDKTLSISEYALKIIINLAAYGGGAYYWQQGNTLACALLLTCGGGFTLFLICDQTCGRLQRTLRAYSRAVNDYKSVLNQQNQNINLLGQENLRLLEVERKAQQQVNRLDGNRTALQTTADSINQAVSQSQSEINLLQTTVYSLVADNNNQKKQIEELNQQIALFSQQNTTYQKSIHEIASMIPELSSIDHSLQNDVSMIQRDSAEFARKLKQLEGFGKVLEMLRVQNLELQKKISLLQDENNRLGILNSSLETKLKQLDEIEKSAASSSASLQTTEQRLNQERQALELVTVHITNDTAAITKALDKQQVVSHSDDATGLEQQLAQFQANINAALHISSSTKKTDNGE